MFDRRWWKFWWQRRTRGWDDCSIWNLDKEICDFVLPRLKRFKEIKNGYPGGLTEEKWGNILDKIIYSLERIRDKFDLLVFESQEESKEKDKKMIEGLSLFGDHFTDLWD